MTDFVMQTFTGGAFDLSKPRASDVDPIDVAHALAMLCRFSGHTRRHYSVAEHSLLVARHVPPELRRAALLHDAHEAYIGDVIWPMQRAMDNGGGRVGLTTVARGVELAIAEAFGVDAASLHHPAVIEADLRALLTERRDVLVRGCDQRVLRWRLDDMGLYPFDERIDPRAVMPAGARAAEWLSELDLSEAARVYEVRWAL